MDDVLISQFIDDELDLDEKFIFVESLLTSHRFADEVLIFLDQEKLMHQTFLTTAAESRNETDPIVPASWPWRQILAAFAVVLLLASPLLFFTTKQERIGPQPIEYRFVLYRPSALQASVIGSFTDWASVPMERAGASGYWTLTLNIPPGEHRYSFVVDRDRQLADPTVSFREEDDFGGTNSILILGADDEPLS